MKPQNFYARHGKRWFDFSAAAVGLLLLILPMALIGLMIWLTDGWPVLFRQQRVGRRGRLFSICKFRTMTNRPAADSTITISGDARVTRLGKLLRRFKLDELPQLANVLKGEMSLVGPRPDVSGYLDRVRGDAERLLALRPGITGPATLAFRNEEELLAQAADPKRYNDEIIFPEKVRVNLTYLDAQSLATDLACIVNTIFGTEMDRRSFQGSRLSARTTDG
jgi:lipopolysaccharide/colanic/teichoic acid biosynthesis glycosyltransferase